MKVLKKLMEDYFLKLINKLQKYDQKFAEKMIMKIKLLRMKIITMKKNL